MYLDPINYNRKYSVSTIISSSITLATSLKKHNFSYDKANAKKYLAIKLYFKSDATNKKFKIPNKICPLQLFPIINFRKSTMVLQKECFVDFRISELFQSI